MAATERFATTGNVSAGTAVTLAPDYWYSVCVWEDGESDISGATCSLEQNMEGTWTAVKDEEGTTQTITTAGGNFQFCPASTQIRPKVTGLAGSEELQWRVSRIHE